VNEDDFAAFRQSVYEHFKYAKDAAMNLLDSLCAYPAKSIIELSLSAHFKRQHHSVARAIQDYPEGRNSRIKNQEQSDFLNLFLNHLPSRKDPYHYLALDVTPQPKPYSNKMKDKQVIHQFTPTPGQKPIAIGHNISCVGENLLEDAWFLPFSTEHVPFEQCQVAFGLNQAEQAFEKLKKTSLIAADAKYSCAKALSQSYHWSNQVLLARLSPTRVFYKPHQYTKSDISKRGRPTIYGDQFSLRDCDHHRIDASDSYIHTNKKGSIWHVTIDRYDNLIMKADAEYALHEKPVSILRITVKDETGSPIYKEPLWLVGSGSPVKQIDLISIFLAYNARFNIEHWFRFAKQQLLFGSYQTPDIDHAKNWLAFPVLATHQLYHARNLSEIYKRPWETKITSHQTPTQVKRSMDKVLSKVGTPASEPIQRGLGLGRKAGQKIDPRPDSEILFKGKKSRNDGKIIINIPVDNLEGLGAVEVNAKNLPNSGKELKKVVKKLFETGQAELENAA